MKKLLLSLLVAYQSFAGVTDLVKNESGVCSQDVNFTAASVAGESILTTSDWAAPGAIGATAPAAGTFTTATANAFIPNSATVPANGVYLPAANSVGIATATAERLRIDASGNLGLGVTPSAWASPFNGNVLQLKYGAICGSGVSDTRIFVNSYYDGAYKYIADGYASRYDQSSGGHYWFNAPSGTAGNAITFTQAMTLASTGNLLLGATSEPSTAARLVVKGSTADGTTNILEAQDSAGVSQVSVNTDGKITAAGSVQTAADQAFYIGDSGTNNSWRITLDGSNLVIQRRESGNWVTKQTVTP